MAYSLKASVFAVALAGAAHAECGAHEVDVVSCQIQNSAKELSVCITDQTVHYRYGVAGQESELTLSEPVATIDYTPWPGVGSSIWEEVIFENNEYSYLVYMGIERWAESDDDDAEMITRHFGGVFVKRGVTTLAEIECTADSVSYGFGVAGLWEAKLNAGLTWGYRNHEWHSE